MGKASGDVVLGGRAFEQVGVTTVEHDHFFWKIALRAGLKDIDLLDGETPDDFARRLLHSLIESGESLALIGCALKPRDVARWSPEVAMETAAFVGGLTSDEDKETVKRLLISALVGFFGHGLISLWTSRSSSMVEAEETRPRKNGEATDTGIGVQ